MPYIDLSIAAICFSGGIWLGITYGDKILAWYKGAEKYAQDLKAKAAVFEAKAAAAKAAVSK
jgi:hypothetical protein